MKKTKAKRILKEGFPSISVSRISLPTSTSVMVRISAFTCRTDAVWYLKQLQINYD